MTKAEVVAAIEQEITITQRVKDELIREGYVHASVTHTSGRIRGLEIALAIVKMLDDGGSE